MASFGINVKDFGALGDGFPNLLSGFFATLASAQAVYPFVTSLSQSLDWAAFTQAVLSFGPGDAGGTVLIPRGNYFLSDTWEISKRVVVLGEGAGNQPTTAATLLRFPANTTGILVHSSQTSSDGCGGDNTKISGLNVHCIDKQSTGHGVEIRGAQVKVHECIVRDFAGDGFHVHGNAAIGEGNANLFRIIDCESITCGRHGFAISGADANAGLLLGDSARACRGWAFFDDSKLGNVPVACHAAGCALGDYKTVSAVGRGAVLGPYSEVEAGTSKSEFSSGTTVVGGFAAEQGGTGVYAGTGTHREGLNLESSVQHGMGGRFYFRRGGEVIGHLKEDNVFTMPGFRGQQASDNYWWNAGVYNEYRSPIVGDKEAARFLNPNGNVGGIIINANGVTYATTSDYRLKDDVRPLRGALARLSDLKPVSFKWKADGREAEGFIAHELQAVCPQAVVGEKDSVRDGEPAYQSVDSSALVALIVAAIQELADKLSSTTRQ